MQTKLGELEEEEYEEEDDDEYEEVMGEEEEFEEEEEVEDAADEVTSVPEREPVHWRHLVSGKAKIENNQRHQPGIHCGFAVAWAVIFVILPAVNASPIHPRERKIRGRQKTYHTTRLSYVCLPLVMVPPGFQTGSPSKGTTLDPYYFLGYVPDAQAMAESPFPDSWSETLERNVSPFRELTDDVQDQLRQFIQVFIREKLEDAEDSSLPTR